MEILLGEKDDVIRGRQIRRDSRELGILISHSQSDRGSEKLNFFHIGTNGSPFSILRFRLFCRFGTRLVCNALFSRI